MTNVSNWQNLFHGIVIGCSGGDEKNRMTTQNRQNSNAKKKFHVSMLGIFYLSEKFYKTKSAINQQIEH